MTGIRTAPQIVGKTPSEVVTKIADFTDADLGSGETLSTIVSTVVTPSEVGGLAVDSSSISGLTVLLKLSGGLAATQRYAILVTVTTSASHTIQGNLNVNVGTP